MEKENCCYDQKQDHRFRTAIPHIKSSKCVIIMTWKKKIAGTAAMFILGFIFILPVLWIVMNSIKTSPEIAADFLALPKSLYLDNFKNAMESMNFLVALKNSVVITLGAIL